MSRRRPYAVMGRALAARNAYLGADIGRLGLTSDDVCVDIGAGVLDVRSLTGAARYLSTDIRHLPGLDFVADGTRLPFRDGQISVVLGLEVLEHVPDPGAMLREAARVLKPGGRAYFSVPSTLPRHSDYDFWRFTPQGLSVLGEAAFPQSEVVTFGHTFQALAVLGGCYIQLAANRYLQPLERAVPVVERWGERLDGRVGWAASREGQHTLQCDLLLVGSRGAQA